MTPRSQFHVSHMSRDYLRIVHGSMGICASIYYLPQIPTATRCMVGAVSVTHSMNALFGIEQHETVFIITSAIQLKLVNKLYDNQPVSNLAEIINRM